MNDKGKEPTDYWFRYLAEWEFFAAYVASLGDMLLMVGELGTTECTRRPMHLTAVGASGFLNPKKSCVSIS